MVKLPVPTTFATAEPEMVPKSALLMEAIFAGPPTLAPPRAMAISMKKSPTPVRAMKAPNSTSIYTCVAEVAMGVEKRPSVSIR